MTVGWDAAISSHSRAVAGEGLPIFIFFFFFFKRPLGAGRSGGVAIVAGG